VLGQHPLPGLVPDHGIDVFGVDDRVYHRVG
jgi:hypothetical protein